MKTKRISGVVLLIVLLLLILSGFVLAESEDRGLVGTINGKEGIRMRLGVKGSELSGFYFYDAVRTMISLSGTLDKEKNVTLKEFDSKGNWVATFKGKWTSKGITGTWASQDGAKKYPFSLTFTSTATISAGRYLFAGGGTEGVFIYDGQLSLQKQIPTTSRVVQLRKDNNYLYILEETNRMKIYDIKNPKSPVLVTEYTELVQQIGYTDFFLENNRLVFFNPRTGLLFVDIKDRKKPVILGAYPIDGRTPDFAYANNKGYFYDEVRFYVVDFTDVKKPVAVYEVEHHHMQEAVGSNPENEYELRARILVNGPRVYVLGVGLTTYDFSRKDGVRITRSELNPYLQHAALYGKYLYVTTTYSSLCVYELVNFETAKLIKEYDPDYLMDDDLQGLFIQDSKYLYIASGRRGIALKNVEDPKNVLSWTCSEDEGGYAYRVYPYQGKLLVQLDNGRFDVIDPVSYKRVATLSAMMGWNDFRQDAKDIDTTLINGDSLYILDGVALLYSLDLKQKEFPQMELLHWDVDHMVVNGSFLYSIYPSEHDDPQPEYILDIRDTHFIGENRLKDSKQYNLTDYMQPEILSQVRAGNLRYQILTLFFRGNLAYVEYGLLERSTEGEWEATTSNLTILDVTNINHLVKVADLAPIYGFTGFINAEYALSGYGQIIDFHNPVSPKGGVWLYKLETVDDITTVYDLEMVGTYGYLSLGDKGFHIFDLSDPTHPILVKKVQVDGFVRDIAIIGKKAFVAAGYNGYLVYDISNPKEPRLIHNSAYSNLFQVVGY